jgi:hypothetical protein
LSDVSDLLASCNVIPGFREVYGRIDPPTAIVSSDLFRTDDTLLFLSGEGITAIEFSALTSVGRSFAVIKRDGLTSIILASLRSTGDDFAVTKNAQLTYLSAPALTYVGSFIELCQNSVELADPWPVIKPVTGQAGNLGCDLKTGNTACDKEDICP